MDHPEIWRRIYPDDTSSLIDQDGQLAIQYTSFVVNFFERLYLPYQNGAINDHRWKAWASWLDRSFSASPLFQSVRADGCAMDHPDFVAYFRSTLRCHGVLAGDRSRSGNRPNQPAVRHPASIAGGPRAIRDGLRDAHGKGRERSRCRGGDTLAYPFPHERYEFMATSSSGGK